LQNGKKISEGKPIKTKLIIIFLIAFFPGYTHAKDVSYADIAADPAKYVGKRVVMKGFFLYSEPVRESFTIDQNGNSIEVFYGSVSGHDRQFILSQRKYSKAEVTVSGILQRYTNSAHAYFINASSLSAENGSFSAPPRGDLISWPDILSAPDKYLNKQVMMKGSFIYSEPSRQSFTFDQSGTQIEVFLGDLSRTDRELIFSKKNFSKLPVTVIGVLQKYANKTQTFFINASSVFVGNQ
jgi:uncharacterized metal-binding protein